MCSVEGCSAAVSARGLCHAHYMRVRRGNGVAGMHGRAAIRQAKQTPEDRRAIQRAWAAADRAAKRARFRAIVDDFLDRPCVDCGVQYARPAMQPDHVRGVKARKIADFTNGSGTEHALRAELAKCDVRCANCHCIRHAAERT